MAELGIVASIVGLLTTGAKLSVVIFDFASTVGSAEQELYSVGKEISLFCSVLEQVQNLLSSRTSHFSVKAVEATQKITEHCAEILQQIGDIIEKLMNTRGADLFPSMEIIQKVKWTFRRPKVLQLQKTLEGCKLTLHLMLTSSDIARKRSSHSVTESSVAAIAREKLLAQSLLLSRQSSIQELGALEDEVENESKFPKEEGGIEQLSSNSSSNIGKTQDSKATTLPSKTPTRQDRASIWLQLLLPQSRGSVDVHPGMKYRRMSSHDASLRSAELLEWWTVGDVTSSDSAKEVPPVLSIRSPFSPANKENKKEGSRLGRAPTDLISPTTTSGRVNSYGFGDIDVETHNTPIAPQTVHFEPASETRSTLTNDQNEAGNKPSRIVPVNIRVGNSLPSLEQQSSRKVIDHIQQEMALSTSTTFTLAMVYGGNVREFKDDDKPLDLVSQFDQLGLDPFLMMRAAAV